MPPEQSQQEIDQKIYTLAAERRGKYKTSHCTKRKKATNQPERRNQFWMKYRNLEPWNITHQRKDSKLYNGRRHKTHKHTLLHNKSAIT